MTKNRGKNLPKATWSPERDQELRSLYPDNSTEVVGELMGLRTSQVYNRAHWLGLHKTAEFMESTKSGRIQRGKKDPRMTSTQFRPGIVPWNKGTNYVAGGRSAETRFQKGRKPEESRNYLPIGSVRVCADGYLERKVTDNPKIVPARRWVAVHRLVWEQVNGPIPAGHVVVYKPGRKTLQILYFR